MFQGKPPSSGDTFRFFGAAAVLLTFTDTSLTFHAATNAIYGMSFTHARGYDKLVEDSFDIFVTLSLAARSPLSGG